MSITAAKKDVPLSASSAGAREHVVFIAAWPIALGAGGLLAAAGLTKAAQENPEEVQAFFNGANAAVQSRLGILFAKNQDNSGKSFKSIERALRSVSQKLQRHIGAKGRYDGAARRLGQLGKQQIAAGRDLRKTQEQIADLEHKLQVARSRGFDRPRLVEKIARLKRRAGLLQAKHTRLQRQIQQVREELHAADRRVRALWADLNKVTRLF